MKQTCLNFFKKTAIFTIWHKYTLILIDIYDKTVIFLKSVAVIRLLSRHGFNISTHLRFSLNIFCVYLKDFRTQMFCNRWLFKHALRLCAQRANKKLSSLPQLITLDWVKIFWIFKPIRLKKACNFCDGVALRSHMCTTMIEMIMQSLSVDTFLAVSCTCPHIVHPWKWQQCLHVGVNPVNQECPILLLEKLYSLWGLRVFGALEKTY